jgi:IS4 transposase
VIRIGWQNLPLQDREGRSFSLTQWLAVQSIDPSATPAQVAVWVKTPQGRFPVRVIARAIPPDKAMLIRQKLRATANKRKTRLDERTLLAAGFVMVVSNLPELTWDASDILALYRFRWQIELVFKRLKSILTFDHLRATDPQLAQVYLLTKLLITLLLTEDEWRLFMAAPESFQSFDRPISRWRLTQLTLAAFRQSICGSLTWEIIIRHLPELERYLCDEPRRRQKQLVSLLDFGMICGF